MTELVRQWLDLIQKYNGAVTAIATVFIGLFTLVLALVTARQARLATASIELARTELISTHRPRLIMRRLFLRPMEVGKPPAIQYNLANVGGSTARIVSFEYTVWIGSGGVFTDVSGNIQQAESQDEELVIRAGEAVQSAVTGKSALTQQNIDEIKATAETAGINFLGVIAYKDEIGIKRRTAFWRRYEPRAQRFVASPDTDLEYAD